MVVMVVVVLCVIAMDPNSNHVFAVSSFSTLDGIKSSFQAQFCPVGQLVDIVLLLLMEVVVVVVVVAVV